MKRMILTLSKRLGFDQGYAGADTDHVKSCDFTRRQIYIKSENMVYMK